MILVPLANRTKLQYLALLLCLAPLMRIVYLDLDKVEVVIAGLAISRERIYLVVLLAVLILGLIAYLTLKYGRFFCAFLCPVHLYLEHRQRRLLPWLLPPLFTEAAVTFVFSYSQQREMYAAHSFPQPILIAHAIILAVMVAIFVVYKDRFCRSSCPYAVFQNVCRSADTVITFFDAAAQRCVDCLACDAICPMKLDVRNQCVESLCTNCALCIDACAKVLGEDKTVISQVSDTR